MSPPQDAGTPSPRRPARRKRRRWIGPLVVLIALALSLVLGEVAARLFATIRNVGPSFSTYDPEYGQRLKKSFHAERITPEFTMTVTTNAEGFRGPELSVGEAGSVVFLGDSFTMGYGVSDGEEFPALVRRDLRARLGAAAPEVVNAGIGATGNGHWLKFLRSEAARFKPRAVVLQLCSNDFGDNLRERLFGLDETGELRALPVPPPTWQRSVQAAVEAMPGLAYSRLVSLIKQAAMSGGGGEGPRPGQPAAPAAGEIPGGDLTRAILRETLAECRARGWPVLVICADLSETEVNAVRDVIESGGADLIVMPDKASAPEYYFRMDGHWIPRGHEVAATKIRNWLVARLAPGAAINGG